MEIGDFLAVRLQLIETFTCDPCEIAANLVFIRKICCS